ncbi:MAG: helix-turn-helix domain-containing protein [Burkholderiaceae bacterium]|nr:helix-turn-helix domain-containing protein [Burkholderiaceae bacterium]
MNTTKKHKLLKLLKAQWTTPIEALEACGILSLSQRVSEWRAAGVVILDKWVTTGTGARVKAYRVVKVCR